VTSDIDFITACLRKDAWSMQVLRAVRTLVLPDWAIGAGFVRNPVWDAITNKTVRTKPSDVDVLYFDPADLAPEREQEFEAKLKSAMPDAAWSVTNQARMHLHNGDAPYKSTADALRFWLETPTAIAVTLDAGDQLHVMAPFGIEDLMALRVRPTPRGRERIQAYRTRVETKQWQRFWPTIQIEF
jgi:hypothetical protein